MYPINFGVINTHGNCCIVRRSELRFDETFNELGLLRPDAITPEQTPGLSLNLLGGLFKISDLKYVQEGEGRKPWQPATQVYFIDHVENFRVVQPITPIYFLLSEVHDQTFPYYKPTTDKSAKSLFATLNLNPPIVENKYKLYGKTEVKHAPNNLNYWHVEIILKDIESKESKGVTSSTKKSIAEEAFEHVISISGLPSIRNILPIQKQWYCRA